MIQLRCRAPTDIECLHSSLVFSSALTHTLIHGASDLSVYSSMSRSPVSTAAQSQARGYAYVPRNQLESIQRLGYLSARLQVVFVPNSKDEIIRKYEHQANQALMDSSFVSWSRKHTQKLHPEVYSPVLANIMRYLDWREEITERGASAVYFLFAPIPLELHSAISKQRHGFLEDRALISFPLPPECTVFVVNNNNNIPLQPAELSKLSEAEWLTMWKSSLSKHENDPNVLWLSDIPHGFIIPQGGHIEALTISVIKQDDNEGNSGSVNKTINMRH